MSSQEQRDYSIHPKHCGKTRNCFLACRLTRMLANSVPQSYSQASVRAAYNVPQLQGASASAQAN